MPGAKLVPGGLLLLILLLLPLGASTAQGPEPLPGRTSSPVGSTFAYQGLLTRDGSPIDGYKLCAGFWCGPAVSYTMYLPLVLQRCGP